MRGGRRVWYAAYGSNMCAGRLRCYLLGGRPDGAARTYPGARDARMPVRSRAVELAGTVYFATHSPVWQGGRAFYDPAADGTAWGRAHLLTEEQLADLAAQEMYREPGRAPDLGGLGGPGGLRPGERRELGPGRYETLVRAGDLDGLPVLTLTAPWGVGDVPWTAPSAAYLRVLAEGLREAGGHSAEEVAGYLASRPGAAGHWTAREVARVAGQRGRG